MNVQPSTVQVTQIVQKKWPLPKQSNVKVCCRKDTNINVIIKSYSTAETAKMFINRKKITKTTVLRWSNPSKL